MEIEKIYNGSVYKQYVERIERTPEEDSIKILNYSIFRTEA